METPYDYKKFAILYVDDEEKSLKYFTRSFDDHFRIFTASNAADGFEILKNHADEIGILITDQRMPGEKGVQLLEKVRHLRPRILRILATAYSDMDAAIDAVNTGAIYKYITKPWDIPYMEMTLRRGLEFFIVQQERDGLLKEKIGALHRVMMTDRLLSLGILASGLGHHMRNSLVAVKTFLDLAPAELRSESIEIEKLRNPNFWNDFYGLVKDQVKKIIDILADLEHIPDKPKPDLFKPVDLLSLIRSAVESFQPKFQAQSVSLESHLPQTLAQVKGDSAMFDRLFRLLLADELASLAKGQKLSFTVKEGVSDGAEPKEILIVLEDDGKGLSDELLRSVFDPFFVRSNGAQEYGINLLACYFIVHHHGGSMKVENRSEGGLRLSVRLPFDPDTSLCREEDRNFLQKVFINEQVWEDLLAKG
ncbi:MAG: hybrid sensor histidine kinase/response regulator [Verrucomicrobiae bacterium]|nr:hybrid sensor histidine kinase/response regulator [Verrucomicrobiae bacterium]